MTVDKLNHNKIMITLCSNDMRDFSLDYDTLSLYNSHSRKVLLRILNLACFKSGIETKNKSMVVEAIPTGNGCVILLTLITKNTEMKNTENSIESICYNLGDSKNFLDTIEILYKQKVYCNKNSAYMLDENYYLIFEYSAIPKKINNILKEYGKKCGGRVFSAKIKECGKEICKTNAIAQIGRFL